MTRGRKKWRVRLAFEPNRYAQEQLQKAYEQISLKTAVEAAGTVGEAIRMRCAAKLAYSPNG